MPRVLKNRNPDDELAGLTVVDLKNEYKKLKSKYDKIYGGLFCHDCNRFLSADKFYVSNKWASGVVPTCKECLNKIALGYNSKTKKTNETEESFKKALQIANLPFLRKEYNSSVATVSDTTNGAQRVSSFQQYMGLIQSLPQYKDMRWEDGELEAGEEVEEEKEVKLSKEKKKIAIKRFGAGYTDGEYAYLENEYQDWVSRYTCENKAQEILFSRICCKELEIHKAELNGEDTKDLDKTLQELMSSLNIKPNQKDAKGLAEAKTFGQLIEMWEEEQPIPEPEDEFKDCDGIGHYIRTWFAGWLGKAVGITNAFTQECEEEISKYEVQPASAAEEKFSEEIYESIFGKIE